MQGARVPETLRFHKSFYAKQGIDAAAEAYASLADITVGDDGDAFTAVVTAHEASHYEAIVDHFGNHALFASLACQMEGP